MSERQAAALRDLHRGPRLLVLPNAWDVASARAFAACGFPAIATSSSGVAAAHGYPDGEQIPPELMLAAVERIARAVDVPVTADLEAGYGDPVATARAAWDAGVVGLNFEDRSRPLDEHVAGIRAIRETALPLVLNARTDVYLDGSGSEEEAIERANAYLAAGADCAFAIGVTDLETIGRLAAAIDGPLNVLAEPESPRLAELEALGVRRVSFGSGLFKAALRHAEVLAASLRR